ncbi:conjugal transfer protein [uncultured Croceitalea sp.]|uniref:conjugal transfer protein n=1 Tax=uncultured Croceitalea sp. TaxID=1798908 RepID=UPI0033057612
MKTRILIIITIASIGFFLPGRAAAQGMPVYDNTNFVSMAKSLLESAKQTSELLKTVEFLKEQKERIEEVSNVVRQLKAVRDIIRNNERLYIMVRQDLRNILNSPYIRPEEVERVSESFNSIIENSMADIEFINEILSSGHLKLTDSERMEVIQEREKESIEMVMEIERKTQRYNDIIAFREMQNRINNRETNY